MEKSVNIPAEMTAENPKAKSRRVELCLLFFLLSAILAVFTVMYLKEKSDVFALRNTVNARIKANKNQTMNYAKKMTTEERMWTEKRLNDSERYLRRYIDALKSSTNIEIHKLQDANTRKQIEPNLNTSLQMTKKDVGALIFIVQSLIKNLTRLNNSSDSKMRRLRGVLKDARDDLIVVESELTRLNVSLRAELERTSDSLIAYIDNLRENLTVLSNSSTSRINQLWVELNQTNEDILNILEAMTQQNESFHSKVRHTSDTLSLKVKSVEKKLAHLRNSSSAELHRLRSDLNNTQGSLQMAHNDISWLNRSLNTALKEIANSLRSSKNVNEKVTNLRNDFESNKNDVAGEHKAMNEKISKTKVEFQEEKRKSQEDISGLKRKLDSLQRVQNLQQTKILSQEKKIKEQGDTIQQLKNEASGVPHVSLVTVLCVIALLSFFM